MCMNIGKYLDENKNNTLINDYFNAFIIRFKTMFR